MHGVEHGVLGQRGYEVNAGSECGMRSTRVCDIRVTCGKVMKVTRGERLL